MDTGFLTDRGTIAAGSLGATALGIVLREWFLGIISSIRSFELGLSFLLGGFGSFLSTLITRFFGGIALGIRGAFRANAEWLADTFGILAPAAAIVEVAVIVWLIGATISIGIRSITGGI